MREISKNFCMRKGDNISLQNAGESPAKCRRLDRSVNSVTNFIPMVFFHISPENIKKPECFQKV